MLFSLSLRAPIVAVAPLVGDIRQSLGFSNASTGLLTSIPVLCFGLAAPLASQLLRRLGINHAAIYCLVGIGAGSVVRSSGTVAGAFVGTALIGLAMTIGNTAVPMLIGRDYRHQAALLMGVYTATVNTSVTVASAFVVPIAQRAGWQVSLALWGVAAFVIVLLWWVVYPPGVRGPRPFIRERAGADLAPPTRHASVARARPGPGSVGAGSPGAPRARSVWRWPVAWLLAAAFAGHTLGYYAITSWLPSYLADARGMTASGAGYASSLFQALGIVGPLLVPILVNTTGMSTRRLMVLISGCWIAMPLGLVVAPQWWVLWSVLGGAAQGAYFTALFMVIIRRSRTVDENRRLTSMVQTIGYSVAATGPVLMGWLHDTLGVWRPAFLVVTAMLLVMAACSVLAVTDTSTPDGPAPHPVAPDDAPATVGAV
jgi:CP family cyanate transporter-like MFS transporter